MSRAAFTSTRLNADTACIMQVMLNYNVVPSDPIICRPSFQPDAALAVLAQGGSLSGVPAL